MSSDSKNDPGRLSVRGRLRFLAKDVVLYGGASAISRSFALITFPLLARHFSVDAYGMMDLFITVAALLTVLLVFGQDSAVARFFYEHREEGVRRQLLTQSLLFQVACMALVLPVIWWASEPIARQIHDSKGADVILKLVLLQVPFLVVINFAENLLKWTFSRAAYLFLSMGAVICRIGVLTAGIAVFDIGIKALFIINLAVSGVFGVIGLVLVRKWITRPEGFGFVKEMLPFAVPLGAIAFIAAFSPVLERAVVSGLFGSKELGLYAAGTKVALLISLPIQAFQMAWGPFSLAIHKEADAAATYNWVLKSLALGLCMFVLFLSASAEVLLRFLATHRFDGAAAVVFPLALGQAFQAIGWIPAIGISVARRTLFNLYAYLLYLGISATAIFLFARSIGVIGIAYGVLLGFAAKAVLEVEFSRRIWPLQWHLRGVTTLAAATLCLGLFAQWISTMASSAWASGFLLIAAPALGLLGWLQLFSASERSRVLNALPLFRLGKA
jgi:O-antigen/teichoic acid export membrane protein